MAQNPVALNLQKPNKAFVPFAGGVQGDGLFSPFHGAKYHQAFANALFIGANQSGVTTSVGLATTYVGLCLSNPAGATVNLVLRRVSGMVVVITAAVAGIGLITGYAAGGVTVHTTALAPTSSLINGTGPVGKLDSACTLVGTPVWSMFFGSTPTAITNPSFTVDLEGSIVIPPGGYAAIGTTAASSASGFFGSMEWEEVSVATS